MVLSIADLAVLNISELCSASQSLSGTLMSFSSKLSYMHTVHEFFYLLDTDIHLEKILGQGSYGTVYKGTWRGITVAAKVISGVPASSQTSIIQEIEMCRCVFFSHSYIVSMHITIFMCSFLLTGKSSILTL